MATAGLQPLMWFEILTAVAVSWPQAGKEDMPDSETKRPVLCPTPDLACLACALLLGAVSGVASFCGTC